MENFDYRKASIALDAAKAWEADRCARTGIADPWWDAPHYVKAWLKNAEVTDDPEGDLIADMRADPDILHHFWGLKQMRRYVWLKSRGDKLIMAAVPGVWRRYRKWGRHISPPLF